MWRNSNNPKGVAQRERLGKRILDAKIGHKTEMSLAIKSRRERGREMASKRYKLIERPIRRDSQKERLEESRRTRPVRWREKYK